MKSSFTPYLIRVTERYHQTVVIWAHDEDEALSRAHDLCDSGVIDLSRNSYDGFEAELLRICRDGQISDYKEYA